MAREHKSESMREIGLRMMNAPSVVDMTDDKARSLFMIYDYFCSRGNAMYKRSFDPNYAMEKMRGLFHLFQAYGLQEMEHDFGSESMEDHDKIFRTFVEQVESNELTA